MLKTTKEMKDQVYHAHIGIVDFIGIEGVRKVKCN